ncbi:ABC transporter permease [Allopusillimonas soli]|uniref:ABC transporter permease n=1 Tax=Allopusillimonas soli TaxID=659016 RepID=A0A853FKV5_9BURK|nr:ABC transporter permease [Allopusillimonas soli]NYT39001.1 ABC transporter permease [Allopusillimonas soli]TEA69558.1 ABC transporter permease [Allopusillimonas soli]
MSPAVRNTCKPWLLLSPTLGAYLFLLVIPTAFVLVYSLWLGSATGMATRDWTLQNWNSLLGDPFYWAILWQTLRIALQATIVCALLGYPVAYFLVRSRIRNKSLLILMLLLPFWISYIIRTLSWINILGAQGVLNSVLMGLGVIDAPLQMLYNEAAVILGLVHYLLPFMILNIYVVLEGVDRNVEDSAASLGARPWRVFVEVTLPLSLPGLAAGALLCFVLGAGTYVTPMILGGPQNAMFAQLIYDTIIVQLDWPMGAALSILLLVLLTAIVAIYNRYVGLGQVYKSLAA